MIDKYISFINTKSYKLILIIIFFIQILLRIWISFLTNLPWFNTDTYTYFIMADKILEGRPISYFPNGFPLLISLLKYLLNDNYLPLFLILLNILAQSLTFYLLYKILKEFKIKIELILIILLVFSLYPNQINYTRQLLTEPLSLFLLLLSIFLYIKDKDFSAGFLGFLTAQFRPTLLPLFPLIVVYELLKRNYKKAKFLIIGFSLNFLIFYLLETMGIIASPDNIKFNLIVSTYSDSSNINWEVGHKMLSEDINPFKIYFNYMLSNPLDYIKKRLIALWMLWGPYPITHRGIIETVLIAIRFPLIIMSMLYLFRKESLVKVPKFFLTTYLPIFIITFIHTLFFSQQRFTFVVEPFIIIHSVLFIDSILTRYRTKLYN